MAIILAKGNIEEEITTRKTDAPINVKVLQAIGLADKIHTHLDTSLRALNLSDNSYISGIDSDLPSSICGDLDQLLAILEANVRMSGELEHILHAEEKETDIHAE